MLPILNIAGYKFISLTEIEVLRSTLLAMCESHLLKGTILLSQEGINLSLAGKTMDIVAFKESLATFPTFTDLHFHETYSETVPFKRLKVKIKKEIITFRQPSLNNLQERANALAPETLKQWLDENRDFTLLDTRNDYEIAHGTFTKAQPLHLNDFTDLPQAIESLPRDKTVVMFCTGGIRCEKAALYMEKQGFTDVFQLDTGILGYFAKVGGAHYQGDCFVFDERVAVTPSLTPTVAK